ncbi:hypothetical protein ACFW81_24230 [Streptomyces angustmyceticus]|uniref:hypothetical protein n=1 Tax=Streptomyces angustmyceticus TaxID=285578 RepID=UPI00367A50BC
MALNPTPIATTGATHTAQQFRMMLRDLARDNEGVTTGLDLKVTALGTPGAGVQISDGSAVIAGKVSSVQGSYTAYNIGSDTVSVSATGGSPRSDMLVLRVEDPDYEGTRDPASDPIVFWEVVPNVSSSATTVPAGYSAIPLARIDIPASTATITNAMIVDLRKVANPRRDRTLWTYFAANPAVYISGTSETWQNFPTGAHWTIPVPAWAASVKVVLHAACIGLDTGYAFGGLTFNFGGKEAAQWVSIDDNQGTGFRRNTLLVADTLSLTDTAGAALRGTNVTLQVRMRTRSSNAGHIIVDGATTFVADIEFTEGRL